MIALSSLPEPVAAKYYNVRRRCVSKVCSNVDWTPSIGLSVRKMERMRDKAHGKIEACGLRVSSNCATLLTCATRKGKKTYATSLNVKSARSLSPIAHVRT